MSALRELAAYFVAPPSGEAAAVSARPARPRAAGVPSEVGLLCPARDARAAGCATGLHLARATGAQAALVAVWTGAEASPGGAGAPAARAARRLAQAAGARGIAAKAAGRLAVAHLPAEAQAAAAQARRVLAVGAAGPTVLVVAGPREDPLDDILCERELVLVAGDGPLAELAAARLGDRGVRTGRVGIPPAPAAAVAARGAGLLPGARRGFAGAWEGA